MNRKFSLCRGRRDAQDEIPPNGFTLMELLIVMSIITILTLLAIPNVPKLFKYAHELSAKKSLQTIQQAQMMYEANYPANGYACKLSDLGGDPASGPPSATTAQMLPPELASGNKSGYTFTIVNCTKVTVNNTDRITSYQVNAVPETVGKSGDRGFCLDQFGTMKFDPAGGTNCTQPIQ
jgi:type IV pilus assembly protein PilA